MEIALGATIITRDGEEGGKVALVLVNPLTSILSHVVVAAEGSSHDKRAIPLWAVDRGEAGEIFLEADASELDGFPAFGRSKRSESEPHLSGALAEHEPGEFPALFPEDGSLPKEAVALGSEVKVTCGEGAAAGTLLGVEADDYTAEATIMYVRLAGDEPKTVAVPTAWVRGMTSHEVKLECSQGELLNLPESPLSEPESPIEPLQRG